MLNRFASNQPNNQSSIKETQSNQPNDKIKETKSKSQQQITTTNEQSKIPIEIRKTKRILAVDDNSTNIKVLARMLEAEGWPFDTADNGLIALQRYNSTEYCCILMDVQVCLFLSHLN
jgi:PleD family two-component response regulator